MYKHLPSPVNFREDINGLRAWAVMAVLLFHFSLIGLPGGFVGVDIFFVISGYLMTLIVVSKLKKGSFSLIDFYMARVRRILPALLVVITALLILGWYWLPTPDYQALGKESAYSLAFISNIGYWQSAGYFDSGAHEKWLLHTWSLAVEAQFYLLYPIFLAIVWRYWPKIKILTVMLLVLFFSSLLLNIILVHYKPNAVFYLLPTRGWELAAGGLVYLLASQIVLSKQNTKLILWLGWALILASMVFITQDLSWPGYWALFPVLGTTFIIFSNNQDCKLTNNTIAQWLGDRSYSLYLWHWPLVVALYFASLQNDWLWVFGAFLLSLALAHTSYHLVETPTRNFLTNRALKKEIAIISLAVIVLCISAAFIKYNEFNNRLPTGVEMAAKGITEKNPRKATCFDVASENGSPSCIYGDGELGAILLGDSHADAVLGGLAKASELHSKSVMELALSACPTMFKAKYPQWENYKTSRCQTFNEWAFNQNSKYKTSVPIILVSRVTSYLNGGPFDSIKEKKPRVFFTKEYKDSNNKLFQAEFTESIISSACKWSKTRPVYLVRPIPEMPTDVPKTLSRNILFKNINDDIKITLDDYHSRHELVWDAQDKAAEKCGVKILNPLPYLCDEKYCYGSKGGLPYYYDDDHLNEDGNSLLIPMFEEVFKPAAFQQ